MPGLDPALRPKTRVLADVASEGSEWVVDGINESAEEDHDLMTFYQKSGLVPGACVRVTEVAAYNSTIAVEVAGRAVTLGTLPAEPARDRRGGRRGTRLIRHCASDAPPYLCHVRWFAC
jgi:Fe2+ transport system protein FeoA